MDSCRRSIEIPTCKARLHSDHRQCRHCCRRIRPPDWELPRNLHCRCIGLLCRDYHLARRRSEVSHTGHIRYTGPGYIRCYLRNLSPGCNSILVFQTHILCSNRRCPGYRRRRHCMSMGSRRSRFRYHNCPRCIHFRRYSQRAQ